MTSHYVHRKDCNLCEMKNCMALQILRQQLPTATIIQFNQCLRIHDITTYTYLLTYLLIVFINSSYWQYLSVINNQEKKKKFICIQYTR